MAKEFRVAQKKDIPPGKAVSFTVEEKTIAVFNIEGEFYAIEDTCSHVGGPLSQGTLDGETVMCPWHGAKFNVRTGEVLSPPAQRNVENYPVHIQGDEVVVTLPE